MYQKYHIWVFFVLHFENDIVIFKIEVLEFALSQGLVKKEKSLNWGPKMPDLGFLGVGI